MYRVIVRTCFQLMVLPVLLGLVSCKDDEVIPGKGDLYTSYFLLEQGYWIEYDADSIVHLETDDIFYLDTAIVNYSFQIREEIDSSFTDAEGQKAWRISRYRRENAAQPWTFMNLWTARLNNSSAQRVEDNIRFIRLSFPISGRTRWNGNAYNNFVPEEYSYEDIHAPYAMNGLAFDSSVKVMQNEFVSSINRINKYEVYAKNVGMVHKVLDSLRTVNLPGGVVLTLNGFEYRLRATSYKQ